ncbi:hypothetical protein Thal_1032 [Thermocrinis albus DSM 14484]|uniref:Lipopolysaccharide assembly protein A domain-containing protein n=1 Tax=Thermocrinis albus (strain DSM 14484 / JCM 11386 / HI 11/12) TaxID=638303 RepID=D3SLN4_THEAH|nr:LapA family protein [Thermocrinis albus]ADC89664.1 hypothetical protein Thal_1032 [Thermocrinis albus DSM 14484]
MKILKLILLSLLILVFLVFTLQNSGFVEISFWGTKGYVPLFLLVLSSVALGVLLPALYFVPKEFFLRRKLSSLEDVATAMKTGFYQRVRKMSEGKGGAAYTFFKAEASYRMEDLDDLVTTEDPYALALAVRLGYPDRAIDKLSAFLEGETKDLNLLKACRDAFFSLGDIEKAVEAQKRVVGLCERWEKDRQRAILAELMALQALNTNSLSLAEKAVDTYRTPYSMAVLLRLLSQSERTKDLRKTFDKVLELGFQNDVLFMVMEDEKTLIKLMDVLREELEALDPNVAALLFLKLNMPSHVEKVKDKLNPTVSLLADTYFSHREQERKCATILQELYTPWVCVCGRAYRRYSLMCSSCGRWLKIRYVGGYNR